MKKFTTFEKYKEYHINRPTCSIKKGGIVHKTHKRINRKLEIIEKSKKKQNKGCGLVLKGSKYHYEVMQ